MRYVAVTDGDKVEAEIKLGYSVNTYGIGDLAKVVSTITDKSIDQLVQVYFDSYKIASTLKIEAQQYQALREAARIELGLTAFLEAGNYKGFTDTFEDLHGLLQLPGIAAQRLMAKGSGFAAELAMMERSLNQKVWEVQKENHPQNGLMIVFNLQ